MKTINEQKRGCGYRKPGGLYLFCGEAGSPCGKLPIPVHVCPTRGNGVKAGRGFQWVKWEFLQMGTCDTWVKSSNPGPCVCPMSNARDPNEKLGLMWVGEKYYPTPESFMAESRAQGVSKRIPAVPRDFVLGKTWLALAHRKGVVVQNESPNVKDWTYSPGVFSLFLPTEIQYVVTGDESQEELDAMEKKGVTPVQVIYDDAEHVSDGE